MRWSSLCLTAALLLVIMLLPRPKLSLTMHHTVAASPSYPADPVHPRAEPLPPMQELPPSLAATLLSPPPPPATTGVERGGYTFFSTDYHIAPIADITDVFDSLCQEVGGPTDPAATLLVPAPTRVVLLLSLTPALLLTLTGAVHACRGALLLRRVR